MKKLLNAKTCSCGLTHLVAPENARLGDATLDEYSGYYWECSCGSTLFTQENNVKSETPSDLTTMEFWKLIKRKNIPASRPALETAIAYADCLKLPTARNLDWRCSEVVSGPTLIEIMSALVEGYNEFEGKKTCMRLVAMFPDGHFRIAREGSVAIYVENVSVIPSELEEIRKELKADEADITQAGALRLWWD